MDKYPSINWFDAIIEPPTSEQIAQLRKHTGLSGTLLKRLLGLSGRQIISDYEKGIKNGKRAANQANLYTLATTNRATPNT